MSTKPFYSLIYDLYTYFIVKYNIKLFYMQDIAAFNYIIFHRQRYEQNFKKFKHFPLKFLLYSLRFFSLRNKMIHRYYQMKAAEIWWILDVSVLF